MATFEPTIHVIDDDDAVRDSICVLLELLGFPVRPYASSQAFLQVLPSNSNACILADVNMAGVNGLELLEHCRERGVAMPAIVMTGNLLAHKIEHAVNRAGAIFLEKPFAQGELVACIQKALGRDRN